VQKRASPQTLCLPYISDAIVQSVNIKTIIDRPVNNETHARKLKSSKEKHVCSVC
jgi:hypothetical protein